MRIDKIRKYLLPNIPYLFILWCGIKLGTAYRLAAGTGFGEKLIGTIKTIGLAFGIIAPSFVGFDWLVGLAGAIVIQLVVYFKAKPATAWKRAYDGGRTYHDGWLKMYLAASRPSPLPLPEIRPEKTSLL